MSGSNIRRRAPRGDVRVEVASAADGPLPQVGRRTLARIRLVGEALFTTEAGPPPLERLDWLVHETEDFLARSGLRARVMFAVLLFVTTTVAPWFVRRVSRFENLERHDRVRALSAFERAFGEPLIPLKAIFCLIYYEHPDAAREIGFDGHCLLPRAPR